MKVFTILLWASGALLSFWAVLVLLSVNASSNLSIGYNELIVILMGFGCSYMAWREYKSPNIKNQKPEVKQKEMRAIVIMIVMAVSYFIIQRIIS